MRGLLLVVAMLFAQFSYAATKSSFSAVPFKQTGSSAQIAQPGASLTAFPSVGNISPTSNSGWYQAGNYGVAPAASGTSMQMGIDGSVNFSGVKYPFQAAYAVPKINLWAAAQGVATIAGGGWIGAALFAGPYMLDWLTKAGGRVKADGTGLERTDTDACTVAPCYSYYTNVEGVGGAFPRSGSAQSACTSDASRIAARHVGDGKTYTGTVGGSAPNLTCTVTNVGWSWISTQPASPVATVWLPSSMDDIAPYMRQSSVNPDGRVIGELLDKGADLAMPSPAVTGPTSIAGSVTTTNNADGTKSTQQTTYNFNTSGDTINNTGSTTTTNNYNTSNVITSSSNVTKTTAATDAPPDPCDANPDRAGCAKLGDAPTTEKLSKTTQAVNVVAQTFAGGGSCPPPVNFALSVGPIRGSYGFSYTPLCNALVLIRGVILALAALVAAYILADSFKV